MQAQEELPDLGHGPMVLRRRAQARRISLRVSRLDGRISVTAPRHVPTDEVIKFLQGHQQWLSNALSDVTPHALVGEGSILPFRGENCQVHFHGSMRGPVQKCAQGFLRVGGRQDRVAAKLLAFFKEAARAELAAQVPELAWEIGKSAGKITLRDTRSRWGSCTSAGDLMFSWRLIMAPPEVLRYVAAHEVAHLQHMDHSPAFWDVVALLMPDYREPRAWLKKNGASLHQYRFK